MPVLHLGKFFNAYAILMDMEQTSGLFSGKQKYYSILVAVGIGIYLNSLFNNFVWDDVSQIVYNPIVHSLVNIPRLFMGGTFPPESGANPVGAYYRPLITFVFTILYSLFGLQAVFYHSLQVIVHIGNVLLIFIFFKKFFKESIAFILSLIFLVHPINVEAVAYIGTLHVPFFFFFGMSAFLLSMRSNISIKRYISISVLVLCSLLFNETGSLFILLILLYQGLFVRQKSNILRMFLSIGLSVIIYTLMRFTLGKIFFPQNTVVPIMAATPVQRFMTMPAIFLYYIKGFFFPIESFIAQKWVVKQLDMQFFIPLVIDILFLSGLLGCLFFIFKIKRKAFPLLAFFFFWFGIGMLFYSQLYPFDMTVADHWFYFQEVGLLGFLAIIFETFPIWNKEHMQNLGTFVLVIILCLLSLRTVIQNTYWQNEITLYTHSFQYIKGTKVEDLLAVAYYNAGDYQDAQKHFLSLISLNPAEPTLYYNLGLTYEGEKDFQKAEEAYQKMISLDHEEKGYASLGKLVLMQENNAKWAKQIALEGRKYYPKSYYLLLVEAVADYRLGNKEAALQEANKAQQVLDTQEIQGIIDQMKAGQTI